jgi:hypothetical protein
MSIDLPGDAVCPVDGGDGGGEGGAGAVTAGPSIPGARALGARRFP